jgi:hypothetical protein
MGEIDGEGVDDFVVQDTVCHISHISLEAGFGNQRRDLTASGFAICRVGGKGWAARESESSPPKTAWLATPRNTITQGLYHLMPERSSWHVSDQLERNVSVTMTRNSLLDDVKHVTAIENLVGLVVAFEASAADGCGDEHNDAGKTRNRCGTNGHAEN